MSLSTKPDLSYFTVYILLRFDWHSESVDLVSWSPCYSNLFVPDNMSIYSIDTLVSQTVTLTPIEGLPHKCIFFGV